MITDEEKKPKVLSTDELLKRYNAQKTGSQTTTESNLDPWGSGAVDIDEILGSQQPGIEFTGEMDLKDLKKSDRQYQKDITAGKFDLPKKEQGFGQYIGKKLASGVMSLGEMVMETPQAIEAFSNAPAVMLTEGMIKRKVRKGEMDQETGDYLMKEAKAMTPRRAITGTMVNTETMPAELLAEGDVATWFEKNKEKFDKQATKYDKQVIDYIKSGQYGKALGATAGGIVESLPATLAAAFIPGGAAALGLGVGAQQYDEVKDREDLAEGQKMADAVTTGIFEWLFEQFGTREMSKFLGDIYRRSGKQGLEKAFTSNAMHNLLAKAYKKFGVWFAPVHEGLSEGLTTLGQNAAAKFSGEDPERGIADGFWDSVIIGAGMGGVFAGAEKTMEKTMPWNINAPIDQAGGPVTGPLSIEQDPEEMIRSLGRKYSFGGFNDQVPEQNFIKFGDLEDNRKVILLSANNAEDEGSMILSAVDATDPEGTPFMVKGNMIRDTKDIPYEEWVLNELGEYQATRQQIDIEAARATAPVQEGETLPIGEQLFSVSQVTPEGITLNEIDKDGNLTANAQFITPDQYEKVFGVPAQNAPEATQQAAGPIEAAPEVSGQPQAEQTAQMPQNVSQQSRKISDGKNEYTIIPQEDQTFRMNETFQTQREAEGTLKKLQERYPKLTWEMQTTDSGDMFTPDTYSIVATPKKKITPATKEAAPAAQPQKPAEVPESKPVEQVAPEVEPEAPEAETVKAAPGIVTARDAAKDLVRAYVLRGDSIESLKAGMLGSWNDEYHAQIGGYVNGKKNRADQIAVLELNGKKVSEIFSLKELYDEIKNEGPAPKQAPKPSEAEEAPKEDSKQTDLIKANAEVDLHPTEAQKEAGNYQKGHVMIQGLDISIENPAGTMRSGTDKTGKKWSVMMNNTYGYFRRTKGKDGDQVDVFIGDNLDSDAVYVVDQVNPETGMFDEHKVMMGFNSAQDARENYLANYEPGWNGYGSITKMSMDQFKEWLGNAKRTRKPVDANVPVNKVANENKVKKELRDKFNGMTEEDFGVVFEKYDDGTVESKFNNSDYSGTQCTGFACSIFQMLPDRTKIYGFDVESNPAASYFAKEEVIDGHDFAVIDDRYIVDPWLKFLPMVTNQVVFDLQDPADAENIEKYYGDRGKWKRMVDVEHSGTDHSQKQPEDTRPVKKLKEKKGWPMSKADEARLSREPQSFEEAVYQFFLGKGRISTERLKWAMGTRSREDYSSYIWAHKKEGGQQTDKLNEAFIFQAHPELLAEFEDSQMAERAFFDILLSVHGMNDIRTRIDEIQSKIDNVDQEQPEVESPEEQDDIDAGQVITEELRPMAEEDPEIMLIFELEISELGKTLDDLKEIAASDPSYFQVFPYGLNEKQFNEFKNILNDTEKQQQINGLVDQVSSVESRSEGDNQVPGSPEPEGRTDGEAGEEGGRDESRGQAEGIAIPGSEAGDLRKAVIVYFGDDNIDFTKSPISLRTVTLKDGRTFTFSNESLWENGNGPAIYVETTPARPEFAGEQFNKKSDATTARFRPRELVTFKVPLKGPSGAKLMAYEWAWKPEEYVDRRGEDRVKRISDWDKAEESSETGRHIVHQFHVELPDGSVKVVSSESVLQILGFTEKNTATKLPSLISASKTLAKNQMLLAAKEEQAKAYDEAVKALENSDKPPITSQPHINSDGKRVGTYWIMGDTRVNEWDRTGEEHPISDERKTALHDAWIRDQITLQGLKPVYGLQELRDRVKKQKNKIDEILATNEEAGTNVNPEATKYINATKNKAKKAYAIAYHKWILDGRPEGERPENGDDLSYMAAQAVRMQLNSLYPKTETPKESNKPEFAGEILEKKPWQMTKEEYYQAYKDEIAPLGDGKQGTLSRKDHEYAHRNIVQTAIQEGKEVPPNVLAEYPDLQTENKPKEQPAAKEYKYQMLARPFDVATYPKPGFIKAENDPNGGHQILTYSRKLTLEEQRKWDFLPLTEIGEIKGKEFVDKDGYYSRISLDWFGYDKYAKISMYDTDGNLVDEISGMKASEIIQNINDGYWMEKSKTETNDQKDQARVPGEERERKEPEQAKPVEETGREKTEGGGILQAQKDQVDNLKRLVSFQRQNEETRHRIGEMKALIAKKSAENKPTKQQRNELAILERSLEHMEGELQKAESKVDDTVISKDKIAEIKKLIQEKLAKDEIVAQRILRLQDERDAKEKSLQKRNELLGDRKEEEERASGMQSMFAGDFFRPTSENLQSALKPFNDGIKKAEEEFAQNDRLLDQQIDLVLSGAQMKIDMDVPAEPDEKVEAPKSEESNPLQMEYVEATKPEQKIEDFGEHISGAKKEIRGQIKRHLETTDEDILNNSISKVLPPIDYAALVDSGVATPEEAAFLHFFRSKMGPKPQSPYKQKGWLTKVNAYKEYLRWITEKEEFKAAHEGKTILDILNERMPSTAMADINQYTSLLVDLGFPHDVTSLKGYEIRHFLEQRSKDKEGNVVTRPAGYAIIKSPYIIKQFETREEAIAGLKYILTTESEASGQVKFDMWRERNKPGIFVGKKVGPGKFITLAQGFDKVSEARKYVEKHQEELEKMLEAKKIIPYERPETRGPRIGKDYRGGTNVTPEMFSEMFGFRGVQFGNYVEQLRRQEDLNEAYDALIDLADILGIPTRAISLGGQLGIAFGARGTGGKNAAAAHYESDEIVINLTKGNGPGSLAHEWFHAVDNYFSRMRGGKHGFVTERPRQLIQRDGTMDASVRPEVLEAFNGVVKAINESKLPDRSKELDRRRSKDYWSTIVEMGARSFESYVRTKLADKETKNEYLVAFKDMVDYIVAAGGEEGVYPYPTNEEAEKINTAFDNLFQTVRVKSDENNVSSLYEPSGKYSPSPVSPVEEMLDGYNNLEERRQAIQRTADYARQLTIDYSGVRSEGSLFPNVKPRTVLEDFKESGYVDVIGRKVTGPQDIADIWSIHRSPYIEKVHVIFLKDGAVVGSTATTLNRLHAGPGVDASRLIDLYRQWGADGVYFLHNHPSGNHKPSAADIYMTRNAHEATMKAGVNILGHVIIDTEKYSLIDINTYPIPDTYNTRIELDSYALDNVLEFEYKNPVPRLFSERESIIPPGETAGSPERLIEIASALLKEKGYSGAAIYLSRNLQIMAYDPFPAGASDLGIIGMARGALANNIGSSVAFIHDGSHPDLRRNLLPSATIDVINTKTGNPEYFQTENKDYMQRMTKVLWEVGPRGQMDDINYDIQTSINLGEPGSLFRTSNNIFSGVVDLTSGEINQTFTKKQAKDADYHHTFLVGDYYDAINRGEKAYFWIDSSGEPQNMDNTLPDWVKRKIKDQLNSSLFRTSNDLYISTVEQALNIIKQEKATVKQWKAMLLNNGAKQAELDWMGWDDLVEMGNPNQSYTKEELRGWINQSRIEIEEVTNGAVNVPKVTEKNITKVDESGNYIQVYFDNGAKIPFHRSDYYKITKEEAIRMAIDEVNDFNQRVNGGKTKYTQYVLPGGKNYREMLLTLPAPQTYVVNQPKTGEYAGKWVLLNERGKIEWVYDTREKAREMAKHFDVLASGKKEFKSAHWSEPNVLAHVRFNTRTTEDGKNVLFIEEIQSDFAQSIRKQREALKNMLENDFEGVLKKLEENGIAKRICR